MRIDRPRPPQTPTVPRRPAASLILCRSVADALEIYAVQRSLSGRFLPGYFAFPGGAVEAQDASEDAITRDRNAALRETAEEVRLRVDPQTPVHLLGDNDTPAYLGPGYQVRYFAAFIDARLARKEAPHVPADDAEHEHGAWYTPAALLARFEAGQILLAPPTLALLRALRTAEETRAEPLHTAAAQAQLLQHAAQLFARGHLFPPPGVSPIRPHIELFAQPTPTLLPATHTNCYIVGTDRLAVIDPGSPYPRPQADLEAHLRARLAQGAQLEVILLTHHHPDHVGGARALARTFNVPIAAHPLTAERLDFEVHRALDEGDEIALGAHALRVYHTPGHAPGHLCFVDRATRTGIVGDMVAGLGTILIEPGDGDMAAYLEQLDRLRGLDLSALCPSHGNVIGGAHQRLSFYIAHRLAREAKVIEALKVGGDLKALVDHAYADAPEMLRAGPEGGVAGLSLRAHLEKLIAEGRAHAVSAGRFVWTEPSATQPEPM